MRRRFSERNGQSVLEYSVIIAVAILVIVVGQIYFKRALQGRWKDASDQIGEQFTTGQSYAIEKRQASARKEETGTSAIVSPTGQGETASWTKSTVLDAATANIVPTTVGGKETSYLGHEATKTDYVTATAGSGQLGAHGTFDSGKLSETGLFQDD